MAGPVPYEIEHLLAEADRQSAAPGREALRARLVAALAQGLDSPSGTDSRADDPARLAAFLDGQLTGPDRASFIKGLVQAASRRADLEQAAALLGLVGEGPPPPPDLLAQASAKFAPAPVT